MKSLKATFKISDEIINENVIDYINQLYKVHYDGKVNIFNEYIKKARFKDYAFNQYKIESNKYFNDHFMNREDLKSYLRGVEHKYNLTSELSFTECLNEYIETHKISYSFLNDIIHLKAQLDFFLYLDDFENQNFKHNNLTFDEANINSGDNPFQWSGLNERDFIGLIYALIHSGYLKGDKGKIVDEFSKRLNYPLSKQWYSNFSKGIHNNNADFNRSDIFKSLIEGLDKYCAELAEKKKKRSK